MAMLTMGWEGPVWQIEDLGHSEGMMEMSMRREFFEGTVMETRAQFFEGWTDGVYRDGGRRYFHDFVPFAFSVIFEPGEERFVAIMNEWWL